jgi:hypothetical protein
MQILVNLYETVQNDEINTVERCKYKKAQDGPAGLAAVLPRIFSPQYFLSNPA